MADTQDNTTSGKSPAFQFYPGDFLSDGNQAGMSLQECGAYIRLICICWRDGALPNDVERIARMAGATLSHMRKMWPHLSRCFRLEDVGWVHPRLQREREKQAKFARRQSDKGKASAASRKVTGGQPESNRGLTVVQPERQPNVNSSAFSLQSSDKKIVLDEATEEIARDLNEQFPYVWMRVKGGKYHTSRANMDRDLENCRELAKGWPSLPRLLEMLEVFLIAKLGDKNMPGTPGQFLHMAPEMDSLLRRVGK